MCFSRPRLTKPAGKPAQNSNSEFFLESVLFNVGVLFSVLLGFTPSGWSPQPDRTFHCISPEALLLQGASPKTLLPSRFEVLRHLCCCICFCVRCSPERVRTSITCRIVARSQIRRRLCSYICFCVRCSPGLVHASITCRIAGLMRCSTSAFVVLRNAFARALLAE